MKSLYENIINDIYKSKVLEEYVLIESNEIIQLNESFQSKLLINLAKTIQTAEKENAERDKKMIQHYKDQGYSGTPSKNAKSFASIFGPITIYQRWGETKTGLQGLKWDQIKDDDFTLYKNVSENDKEFVKTLKNCYSKKIKANFICCEPGTENIIYFIKGYSKDLGDVRVYGFKSAFGNRNEVTQKTATKYKWGERPLKYNEALELINGCDVYVLEITDSMKKEYVELHNTRIASQKGIINYDSESLKQILKQQKARYQALVKEMKAKKLEGDPKELMDRINKVHQEALDVMQQILSNPENMDEYFDVNRLLSYTSNAYQSFFDAFRFKAKAEKNTEAARKRAKEAGRDFDEEEFNKWNFDRGSSKDYFNKVDEYCKEVEKMIEDMKKHLK